MSQKTETKQNEGSPQVNTASGSAVVQRRSVTALLHGTALLAISGARFRFTSGQQHFHLAESTRALYSCITLLCVPIINGGRDNRYCCYHSDISWILYDGFICLKLHGHVFDMASYNYQFWYQWDQHRIKACIKRNINL